MDSVVDALILFTAVAAAGLFSKILKRLSLPLIQIAIGVIVSILVPMPFSSGINADILLLLFIAPLLFNESRHVDKAELWQRHNGVISLSFGLVVTIMVCVGFAVHGLIPAIPLAIAFAMGAAMGPTDVTAVVALMKDIRFGKRHEALLKGEALFNGVSGTVCFQCSLAVALTGVFAVSQAGELLAMDLVGGLLFGGICGVAAWFLMRVASDYLIDSPSAYVVLEMAIPFVVYLASEAMGIGSIIAVVCCGLVFSMMPKRQTPRTARMHVQSEGTWSTIEYLLNGIIFVVLGMQLPVVFDPMITTSMIEPAYLLFCVVAIVFLLESVRFIWVLCMDVVNAAHQGDSIKGCFGIKAIANDLAMTFAGTKGGVTLSLVLTLPGTLAFGESFILRPEAIFVVSGVILCTLLLANFAVPALVGFGEGDDKTHDSADSEIMLLGRTMVAIQLDSGRTGLARDCKTPTVEPRMLDLLETTIPISEMPRYFDRVDESATMIVLGRYSERIKELIPCASSTVKESAEAICDKVDSLYDRAVRAQEKSKTTDKAEPQDRREVKQRRKAVLRDTKGAVSDIQEKAYVQQLKIIESMMLKEELTAENAKELKNEIYLQQMIS